ncbi:MAG: hypothetical protein J5517_09345 [Eubacterium sp.]|nr:hypothetical protein [Eubacterium sp.]
MREKSRFTKALSLIMAVLMMLVFIMGNSTYSEAKSKIKNGTYTFSPCNCSKFVIKNKKLTVKMVDANIEKNGSTTFAKTTMTIPVAKDCEYRKVKVNKKTLETKKSDTTYKKIKKLIKKNYKYYKKHGEPNNLFVTKFVVKKGKVVAIVYYG